MTNPFESNINQSADESDETINDILYQQLGLPEIQGFQLANAHLPRQLILVLRQSGVISSTQADQILERSKISVSEFIQKLSIETDGAKSEVISSIESSALKQIERCRETLK